METLQPSAKQINAVVEICKTIVDLVKEQPVFGVPGGTIYAALMEHGCSLEMYESLMNVIVQSGAVVKRGQCYFPK